MAKAKEKKRRARRRQPRAGWGPQLAQLAVNGPYQFQIDNGAAARDREVPLDAAILAKRQAPWPDTVDSDITADVSPLGLVVVVLRRLDQLRPGLPRTQSWAKIARTLKISPRRARELYAATVALLEQG